MTRLLAGGLVVFASWLAVGAAPVHPVDVWPDHPVRYDFAYLLPLMPLTALGRRLAHARRARHAPA
jgi:hypothetical protein